MRTLRARNLELARLVDDRTAELRASNTQLEQAQDRISHLLESSSHALLNLESWASTIAAEIANVVGVPEIEVWARDGEDLVALAGSGTEPPQIERFRTRRDAIERFGRLELPVVGMMQQVFGVIVVPARELPWTETERRLLASFAHQLGGALELQHLRRDLEAAKTRHLATRAEMISKGISLAGICPRCGRCFDHTVSLCPEDQWTIEAAQILPFRIAERYRLVRLIGEGGMGVVFQARDERLERDVAIKIIRSAVFDQATRMRFDQEARALARVSHEGVISIFDSGELADGGAYLVTELLRGVTLDQAISRHGRGTPHQVASLLRQAGAALGAAHEAGLVHRDIKPQNFFLAGSAGGFELKLIDFGLAKDVDLDVRLTQTGTVVGTPLYLSPEQITGKPLDARSDVYSLAVVAFECITGESLVQETESWTIVAQVMRTDIPSVSSRNAAVPPSVDAAFFWALQKDRQDRPPNAQTWVDSFVEDLEKAQWIGQGWTIPYDHAPDEPLPDDTAPTERAIQITND
jgi:hypothetical protein